MGKYSSPYEEEEEFVTKPRGAPQQPSVMRLFLAFIAGAVVATGLLAAYAKSTSRAPLSCPTAAELCPDVKGAMTEAMKSCPRAAECPQCPSCPRPDCPPPSCPKCPDCPVCPQLELPDSLTKGCPEPDRAKVAAEYRNAMFANFQATVGQNILECAPGKDCRADRSRRFQRIGQKGVTLWFTGLSGSGKTTITEKLEQELIFRLGKNVYRIDGDNLRTGLTRDLGFSPADRAESVRRASETAALFADAGIITMVTLISPYRNARDEARNLHRNKGLPFLEVFLDVPLSVVQQRDPKGLYKKVAEGKIKGFTGVDAPYEPPMQPEVVIKTHEKSVDECVQQLLDALERGGYLDGETAESPALAVPDGGEVVDLVATGDELHALREEAKTLPGVPLRDVDVNWLQVIGEGWASPLRGFMREGALMQALHFNSVLMDPHNFTGMQGYLERQTDWLGVSSYPPERVSMPIPIVLPITNFTKSQVGKAEAVTLYNSAGKALAVLRRPEVYEHRKEEIIARCFGIVDPDHPYVQLVQSAGDWLIGGEVKLLGKITYGDGLDEYRLSVRELRQRFVSMGADTVFAFQTRNPTHAGHAFLMTDAQAQLRKKGYKKPVLWLSPLGGWTKPSDVPLDVRVRQHESVISEGMLDQETTVMAIWPSPMIYAGPTEVQFHAKSRRVGGASYFVVGRDPAGMPRTSDGPLKGEDLYHPDHGRYILSLSPGVGKMRFASFDKVYYDKRDHNMKPKDKTRKDDFISISGTKMRTLAKLGATPCPPTIPSDLVAAKCIPPGFMVEGGWAKMIDYYQNVDTKEWVKYSTQHEAPPLAPYVRAEGDSKFNQIKFALHFTASTPHLAQSAAGKELVSPWHHVALGDQSTGFNMVVEIPRGTTSKLETQKELPNNPIKHDQKKGKIREYTYGLTFFNYGMLPQTWEDPQLVFEGSKGDNDPLDVIELGAASRRVGEVVPVKVIGNLKMIDQGELDHKILALALDDPDAASINSAADFDQKRPGVLAALVDWLKMYKTTDGKEVNKLASDTPDSPEQAVAVVKQCNDAWTKLAVTKETKAEGFWIP